MLITKKIDRNKLFAVIFVLFCTFAYLSTQRGLWDTGKQSDDNQATLTAYLPMFGYHQFDNDVLCDAASYELMPGHRIIYLISSYFLDIMVVPKLIQIFLFYILVYFLLLSYNHVTNSICCSSFRLQLRHNCYISPQYLCSQRGGKKIAGDKKNGRRN